MPLAVLLVNDHDVMAPYTGAVSGILSDIAGLCCFPVLVVAIDEIIGRPLPGRPHATGRWLAVSSAVTGGPLIVMKFTRTGQEVSAAGTTLGWRPVPAAVIDRIERHCGRPVVPPRTRGARDPRPCRATVATRALTALTLESALLK